MPIVKHNLDRYLILGMTWNHLASHWKFWCFDVNWIRGEWKGWKLLGVKPRRLTCAASALPQSYENRTTNNSHIPSICTAQVGLKCLSCTSDSHSVCAVRTLLRSWPEIFSIRIKPITYKAILSSHPSTNIHIYTIGCAGVPHCGIVWLPSAYTTCNNSGVLSSTVLKPMELEILKPLHWLMRWEWTRAWKHFSKLLLLYADLKYMHIVWLAWVTLVPCVISLDWGDWC